MSADNFIAIIKEPDGTFTGYSCSASDDYADMDDYRRGYRLFNVQQIELAILRAQMENAEYGYTFLNLEEPK